MSAKPFQWWPNTAVPRDSAPHPTTAAQPDGFSGRLQFLSTDSSLVIAAATPPPFKKLCAREFAKPTPCVFQAGVRDMSGAEQGLGIRTIDLPAGQIGIETDVAGFFLIEYGTGAAQQSIVMDLRQGSYQLPPCTEVRVYASCYDSEDGGSFGKSVEVTGALTEGVITSPKRATLTVLEQADIATPFYVDIPDGAIDVDIWAPGVTSIGAGKPIIAAVGNAIQCPIFRDYTLGIWAPPYPAPCIGARYSTGLQITTTVDDTEVVVQFGIEF